MSLTITDRHGAVYPETLQMHNIHPVSLSILLTAWSSGHNLRTIHGEPPACVVGALEKGNRRIYAVLNSDANSASDPFCVLGLRESLLKADIHELSPEDVREIFDV